MLWAVRHEWTSAVHFTFNYYRHWSTLVIRDGGRTGNFMYNKDGMTQGEPLAMISYGLRVLLLIRELQEAHPNVTQPWYADDAG